MHDTLMYVVTAVTPKPGKQNTPIYMVTMETSYLGRQATLMYIIHVESPWPGQASHTHLSSYCRNLESEVG